MSDETSPQVEQAPADAQTPPQPTLVKIESSSGPMHTPSRYGRAFMLLGALVLVAGIIFSVQTLRHRKNSSETKSEPVPAKVDSVTCLQKQADGNTKWVYAVNNDERYCASTWAYAMTDLTYEMADPLGVDAIYTLKDNKKEPYTRTLNSIKGRNKDAKGSDSSPGYDSYIPLDSDGTKAVECTNAKGGGTIFKNDDKDITYKVRFKNTGTVDWNTKNIRLIAPNANTTFGKYFFTGQYEVVTDKGTEKRDVAKPGETVEFTASLKLPVKPDKTKPQDGWYTMWWVMADPTNKPFGEIAYCSMEHNSGTSLVNTPALYRNPTLTK